MNIKPAIVSISFPFLMLGNGLCDEQIFTLAEHEHSNINARAFTGVSKEALDFRENRLLKAAEFIKLSREKGTIILDTRSKEAFDQIHLAGAVHLNFSDFTEEKLKKLIPDKNTRILIYCNNNFKDEPVLFQPKLLSLALNIPTFINLYGYGYQNIYELGTLLSVKNPILTFEGTRAASIKKKLGYRRTSRRALI